jgi:sugar phosphate permease
MCVLLFVRGDPEAAGYEMPDSEPDDILSAAAEQSLDSPLLSRDAHRRLQLSRSASSLLIEKLSVLWDNTKIVLMNRYFWTLTLTNSFIPGAFYNITGMWGGPYLRDVFGYSIEQSGYILVLLNLAYIAGTPVLSVISECVKSRKKVICVTAVCAAGVSIGFLFLSDGSSRILLMVLIFALGFFTTGSTSTLITMFKELDAVAVSGTMIGYSNFFPFMATTFLQYFGAAMLEAVDSDADVDDPHTVGAFRAAVWGPTVVCCIIGVFGIFISKDTYPRTEEYTTLPE